MSAFVTMLSPFVFPEVLVVPLVILPIRLRIRQQIRLAKRLEDLGYIFVFSSRVAVGIEFSVA